MYLIDIIKHFINFLYILNIFAEIGKISYGDNYYYKNSLM